MDLVPTLALIPDIFSASAMAQPSEPTNVLAGPFTGESREAPALLLSRREQTANIPVVSPIVCYDQLADHWPLTLFSSPYPTLFYECVALSKTNTPTDDPNDWYIYDTLIHRIRFNDRPRLGVWPDGYYASANQYLTLYSNWAGAGVWWVLQRDDVVAGADPQLPGVIDCAEITIPCPFDSYTVVICQER